MKRLLCLAFAPLLGSGCQSVAPAAPTTTVSQPEAPEPSLEAPRPVSAGERLEIVVHAAPELSRIVLIGPEGEVRIPYVGPVRVTGLSIEDLEQLVRDALASELRNPAVSVFRVGALPSSCTPCGLE